MIIENQLWRWKHVHELLCNRRILQCNKEFMKLVCKVSLSSMKSLTRYKKFFNDEIFIVQLVFPLYKFLLFLLTKWACFILSISKVTQTWKTMSTKKNIFKKSKCLSNTYLANKSCLQNDLRKMDYCWKRVWGKCPN